LKKILNMDELQNKTLLQNIARQAMLDRGLQPDFPADTLAQLATLNTPAAKGDAPTRDLRDLIWCSIDNDDSLDLDQLSVAVPQANGTKILVAVADVDALVRKDTPIDLHAQQNTTSVYTPAVIFSMLPEKLSTNLTSLNDHAERVAVVIEYVVLADGSLGDSDVYQALVVNHAKLAYNSAAAWLDGTGPMPAPIGLVKGLDDNLRLQDAAARRLRKLRHAHGALEFQTIEVRPVFADDKLTDLKPEETNRAKQLIEDFMIAANGVVARFLAAKKLPSLRRVVRIPERWDRIVELAVQKGYSLPKDPDSAALNVFLVQARDKDPLHFPDLSLSVIKLLGSGEYVVEIPGENAPGHFGLAVRDYSHSTAPNRRYPDLITGRLVKAALAGNGSPYNRDELQVLAQRCTQKEDDVKKVERQVDKSAAALLLSSHIGAQFDAIVTGASDKGTFVRITTPPVEGKLVAGFQGVDVGDKIRVQLVEVDVQRGFIDFKRMNGAGRR